ncbi:MAG: hypothetical protein ACYC3W_08570 [Candidatus Nanopelagicales bacterium]
MKRRTFDLLLSITGFVLAGVLLLAGGLLQWGAGFASGTVHDQLVAQHIAFPPAATMTDECLAPLASWGGQTVDSANAAQAYAEMIHCHMQTAFVGMGQPKDSTYSSLSTAARSTDPASAEGKTLAAAVDLAFKGESLRSILLTAYAFGTIGAVAAIAAWVAYGLGIVLLILALLGIRNRKKTPETAVL